MDKDKIAVIGKILALLLLLTFFSSFFFLRGWLFDHDDIIERSPIGGPTHDAGKGVLEKTVFSSVKDGKTFWDMTAETISFRQAEKKGYAQVIECRFYNEQNEVYITFNAPAADIDMDTQSVYFKGMSRGYMSSGDTMEVVRLVWDGEKKKLFGFDGVKIFRKDYTLTSLEMWGDPAIHYIELLKDVQGVWKGTRVD